MKLRLTLRGAPRRRCSDYYLDRIDGLDGFDASADNSAAPDPALFSGIVPGAPYWAVSYAGWQWIGAYLVVLLSGFVLYRCFKRAGKHSAAEIIISRRRPVLVAVTIRHIAARHGVEG